AQGLNPKCETQDQGSNLQVFHIYSPCSPFKPSKPLSWEEDVLQTQAKDQARLQNLSSLVAKKSVVPIASGRQIVQSPTYIVRANIGTPPQTLLMAWILAMMPLGYPALAALAALLLYLTMLNPPLSSPSAAKLLNASR
ncbi:hypothetical protein Gotri_010976, partial [Gossypium trilobum]|nr:hypothetical protein [Gossypium trilobum]